LHLNTILTDANFNHIDANFNHIDANFNHIDANFNHILTAIELISDFDLYRIIHNFNPT